MKNSLAICLFAVAACGGKAPIDAPDYGPEDGKADSARAPSSSYDLRFGEIAYANFSRSAQYRAYRFTGKAGQKVSAYVDGLRGLDTVAYLYKVSSATGKPYGRALAQNDDTAEGGWTLAANAQPNPYSSSFAFSLPADGRYALVATTYDGVAGKAEVTVKAQGGDQQCSGLIAYPDCPSGMFCELVGGACHGADLPGYCKPLPQVCFEIFQPVCGCDGKTYGNDCERQIARAQLDHAGACALSDAQLRQLAEQHAWSGPTDNARLWFDSERAAYDYTLTHGGVEWLAPDGDATQFVSGINDLWAQRFEIDRATGAVTVTAEH